jgi:alcohol dehydrogenase
MFAFALLTVIIMIIIIMAARRIFPVFAALAAAAIALLIPAYQGGSTTGRSRSVRMDPWHAKPDPQATMRAVVYGRHHGGGGGESGADSLRLEADFPRPLVRPRQVLIQVMAASINPVDFKYLRGAAPPLMLPKPKIPGHDVSGRIVQVGERVNVATPSSSQQQQPPSTTWRVGDRVAAMVPSLLSPWGTLAEYVAVDASLLARIPDEMFAEQQGGDNIIISGGSGISGSAEDRAWIAAASLPLVGLTVVRAFEQLGSSQKWEDKKVLVQAGGGGVGTFAIQYAKKVLRASHVATTASSAGKAELLRRLGADLVVDYRATAFEDVIEGYDVVLDPMSWSYEKRTLESKVLKPTGWYLK